MKFDEKLWIQKLWHMERRGQNVAKKIMTSFMDGTYVGIEVRGLPPAKMNFPVSWAMKDHVVANFLTRCLTLMKRLRLACNQTFSLRQIKIACCSGMMLLLLLKMPQLCSIHEPELYSELCTAVYCLQFWTCAQPYKRQRSKKLALNSGVQTNQTVLLTWLARHFLLQCKFLFVS